MNFPDSLHCAVEKHPYPMLFATISGAHLYGFPSPDSDYDLRGVHILPVERIVGMQQQDETFQLSEINEEIELDLVTHDIKKFFGLLLKKNGYVLEQLYSPLIIHTCPEHDELKQLAQNCITRYHSHHYLGFAETQWRLFQKEQPPRVKPLLYVYRVLLTGINLMRTGVIEANLITLNQSFQLPYIAELVTIKVTGSEKQTLNDAEMEFHHGEYQRLRAELERATSKSTLPEAPTAHSELDNLLKRVRMRYLSV
jgi:uncharacterized protein